MNEELPAYEGYKQEVHPGVSHVFQSAAFRFGHTMIPPGIYRRDQECNFDKYKPLRLCSTWWDSSVSTLAHLNYLSSRAVAHASIRHCLSQFSCRCSLRGLLDHDYFS